MTPLSAVSRESTRPLPFSTTIESGVTVPLTTDSPRPHAALIVNSFRRPFEGLAVNITPAASNSTILWTTTARQYQEGLLSVAAGDVLPTYPVDADAFGPVCGPEFPQLSRDPPGRIIGC